MVSRLGPMIFGSLQAAISARLDQRSLHWTACAHVAGACRRFVHACLWRPPRTQRRVCFASPLNWQGRSVTVSMVKLMIQGALIQGASHNSKATLVSLASSSGSNDAASKLRTSGQLSKVKVPLKMTIGC